MSMGHLEVYGAIFPAASQKESGHRTVSLWIILKCVTIPTVKFMLLNFYVDLHMNRYRTEGNDNVFES